MFEDLLLPDNDENEKAPENMEPIQPDVPAQTCWDASGDMWSTKSETWNNESHEKLWSV